MTNRGDSFDRLSRSLTEAKSRREAMRLVGAGIIAAVSGILVSRSARADHLPPDPNRLPPDILPSCSHSKCETGKALSYVHCDDECVREICMWDDYCCNSVLGHWDETCVGYVKSRCGEDCSKPDPKSGGAAASGRRGARAGGRSATR